MKILVTHINPHLDDIAAIWLFQKFHPEFKEAEVKFLSAAKDGVTYEGKVVDSDPNVIHFGIGRGIYDEHKGDIGDCAASLVWKDIKANNLTPKDQMEEKALDELVNWNTLIDTGKGTPSDINEFSVPSFIRPLDSKSETSLEAVELGSKILDRILAGLKRKQQSLMDWEKRVEFETKFGKTIAVSSQTIDRSFCKRMKGDLFLIYNPKYERSSSSSKSVQFFTPFDSDLEPIFKKVKQQDSQADWYLHQSHHIILCGSHTAPGSKTTKLSFEQLIEVAKSI